MRTQSPLTLAFGSPGSGTLHGILKGTRGSIHGVVISVHVAIIEDDPAIAKAVRTAVREAVHECTWIPDGETAIRDQTILSSGMAAASA